MQLKHFLSFTLLLCISQNIKAQVYETLEVVKLKYVGLETFQYANHQPRKGFGILTYNFDLIVSDSLQFRRRKAIYFEQFRGNEICYRWDIIVETEAEMECYRADFDEKFTKAGWLEWERKYMLGYIYYTIEEQEHGYLISANTAPSINEEIAKGRIKLTTPSSTSYWFAGEYGEEEEIK